MNRIKNLIKNPKFLLTLFIITLIFGLCNLAFNLKRKNDFITGLKENNLYLVKNNLTNEHLKTLISWSSMEQKDIDLLYKMLEDTHNIFAEKNIWYITSSGTSLGIARHGGLIPWDDDADLCVMNEDMAKIKDLKDVFKEKGYNLTYRNGLYKISPTDGDLCDLNDANPENTCPFIDLFPMMYDQENNIYKLSNYKHARFYPEEKFTPEQLFPIKLRKFGPIYLQTANQLENYLDREYAGWETTAIVYSKHFNSIVQFQNFSLKLNEELLKPALPSWSSESP